MPRGAEIIAHWLAQAGVEAIFGLVGIPVVDFAAACQRAGITFYAFRHEQSAAYAASAYGYLTGKPGVCLCVSGPGLVHSLPGLVNSQINHWPMLLIGGSHKFDENYRGAFQEAVSSHQQMVAPFVKASATPVSLDQVPAALAHCLSAASGGRPGPAYLELSESVLTAEVPTIPGLPLSLPVLHASVRTTAPCDAISEAVKALRQMTKPLIILGKGAVAASGRIEAPLLRLIDDFGIPFLPSPMAKGLVSDTSPMCAGPVRSYVLKESDAILLVGVRLNWMYDFGRVFMSAKTRVTTFIQIDISGEELLRLPYILSQVGFKCHYSKTTESTEDTSAKETPSALVHLLQGDSAEIVAAMEQSLTQFNEGRRGLLWSKWTREVQNRAAESRRKLQASIRAACESAAAIEGSLSPSAASSSQGGTEASEQKASSAPGQIEPSLTYLSALSVIEDTVPRSTVLISEGANTMNQTRLVVQSHYPKHRLDAGTFACMGPALGYAIAARIATPPTAPVVCIVGDSSIGFSLQELETAARYRLAIVVVVINNNGIYSGENVIANKFEGDDDLEEPALRASVRPALTAEQLAKVPKCIPYEPAAVLGTTISPTALSPVARYDVVAQGLGCHSFSRPVLRLRELRQTFSIALRCAQESSLPVLLNVLIQPGGEPSQKLSTSDTFFGRNKEKQMASNPNQGRSML